MHQHIAAVLRTLNTELLSQTETKAVQQMRLSAHEVKLDVRDYTYAQTRAEQLQKAAAARRNLKKLEASMLELGFLLGAVDVAQLSARIDHVYELLK